MTNTEYNKLLKYLYLEGYANSYEEADYLLEDMSNIERKQLMIEAGIYEGASQDVADRAAKLARQKKGQTPERQKMYQNLAANARERANPYDIQSTHRQGITPQRSTAARDAAAYNAGLFGDTKNTYGRGSKPKNPKKYRRQVATGVRAASSQEKKRLGVKENYELLLDYLIDEGYTNTVDGALTIIENMSENWMESILEAYKRLPVGKMMRKVEYRAEREADTRAEREREADNPNSILGYDRARKAHERAERDKERSNEMIRVADTHSKKEAKSKSKYKK